jgi:hypothetical protein
MDDTTAAILLAVFAASVVFGAIASWAAETRHRGPIGWFFLGFLLNWLALVMLIAAGDGMRQRKVCPDCVLAVPRAAKVCGHCRYRFAEPDSPGALA